MTIEGGARPAGASPVHAPVREPGQDRSRGRADRPLRAASVPRRPAAVGYIAMLLALVLTVLGVLAMYDGLLLSGLVDGGEPVVTPVVTGPAEFAAQATVAVVGALAMLLGLWLLWTAFKPGRKPGMDLGSGTGVWATYGDLERIAVATAEHCDGVLTARASANRLRIAVRAETTTYAVQDTVRRAVTERLAGLSSAPRVSVTVRPRYEQEKGGAR